MKRSLILLISCLLMSFTAGEEPQTALVDHHAKLFAAVFKTVNENFVDSLDPAALSRVAIDAMMSSLDPYSRYFDEAETKEREKTWRGQLYAGIGAGVAPRDSFVVITEPYEGYGAHLNDLRTGDIIYAVNGKLANRHSFEEVLSMLRGEPGTTVEVTVNRPGIGKLTKKVERKQIFTKSILYHEMLNESTGYINVSQFLKESDTKFRECVVELKKQGASQLVLDLRDNIGGLVQESVNCLSCFLPKGTKVCSLKGAHPAGNYEYVTDQDPVDTSMAIVVLINHVTVSSGEIFAGALQDLDRAVLIGQRTFGKGFVQGTRYPGFNTSVYLTAARYYTPSGRCIQELDYSSSYKDKKIKKMPDSLRHVYSTRNGRKVYNIGGVEPDVRSEVLVKHELVQALISSEVFQSHATHYRNNNEIVLDPVTFHLSKSKSDELLKLFSKKEVLDQLKISADHEIKKLEESLSKQDLIKPVSSEIASIRKKLDVEKLRVIQKNRDVIIHAFEEELVKRYKNRSGWFKYKLGYDMEILTADSILRKRIKYNQILIPQK